MIGDLNAKVGRGRIGEVVGDFGFSVRSKRGEKWVEYYETPDLGYIERLLQTLPETPVRLGESRRPC